MPRRQHDALLGASTLNIGPIAGGRAPNVIPDKAQAELFIRLVDDGRATQQAVRELVSGIVEVKDVLMIPAIHLGTLPGFETTVVAYTTDEFHGSPDDRPGSFDSVLFAHVLEHMTPPEATAT